jgi:metal-responsive CopG/Arc/MetJ family transcriptional regulator
MIDKKLKKEVDKLVKSVRHDMRSEIVIKITHLLDEVKYTEKWPARSKSAYIDALNMCTKIILETK